MEGSIQIIRPEDVASYEPGGHASTQNRRLLRTEGIEIIFGQMTRGGASQGHVHKVTDQLMFILEGTGSIMKDGKIREIMPDTLLYLPTGAFHGGEIPLNRTDKILSFLVIYTPPLNASDIFPEEEKMERKAIQIIEPDQSESHRPDRHLTTKNRRLLRTKNLEIILGWTGKGDVVERHTHSLSDQIIFVIQGAGIVEIGSEVIDVKRGTLALIPKGVSHGGKTPISRTDEPLKSLVIYSPPLTSFP
jgi:mannose-6-phosphate isomerase-like protein (cupin superfamily)